MGRFVFTLLAAAGFGTALAGVHAPDVEQRLSFIVNDWSIEGAEAT